MHVDAEVIFWRDRGTYKIADVVARLYDRKTERHYTGTGDTVLEALAWCMHDFIARAALGLDPGPARKPDAKPGDFSTASSRPRRITPAPIATDAELVAGDGGQCFEQQIPRAAAPRLHHETRNTTAPKKRARGGRGT